MKMLGIEAFYHCSKLVKITLPEGLEKIDRSCFAQSGLEEIVLPTSVREVAVEAFSECK